MKMRNTITAAILFTIFATQWWYLYKQQLISKSSHELEKLQIEYSTCRKEIDWCIEQFFEE